MHPKPADCHRQGCLVLRHHQTLETGADFMEPMPTKPSKGFADSGPYRGSGRSLPSRPRNVEIHPNYRNYVSSLGITNNRGFGKSYLMFLMKTFSKVNL